MKSSNLEVREVDLFLAVANLRWYIVAVEQQLELPFTQYLELIFVDAGKIMKSQWSIFYHLSDQYIR